VIRGHEAFAETLVDLPDELVEGHLVVGAWLDLPA